MKGALLIICGCALQLPPAASAHGQRLSAEQRIRITAPQVGLQRQSGRLVWLDADSLVLTGPTRRWTVPRHQLTGIESFRGTRGHALIGLAAGGAIAFVVGAILFSPTTSACTGSGDYAKNCRLYRAGIVVGGAGLGALVGSLIRSEQWASVNLDATEFDPSPRD